MEMNQMHPYRRLETNKTGSMRNLLQNENLYNVWHNNKDCINFDLSNDQYKSLVRRQQKNINLSNLQIYLPPPSTIASNIQTVKNYSSNDSDDTFSCCRSPAPTLIRGSICNCVNIASCSRDKIDDFIHSKDCHLNQNNAIKSKLLKTTSEFGIQREHF